MAWTWRLEDSAGNAVDLGDGGSSFPSRADAESWLGEEWRELADRGVDQVSLFEEEREVYGPMSLRAP